MTSHHSSLGAAYDPLHIQAKTPFAFFAQLREKEPITFSPAINAYLISHYDDIRSILSRPDLFSSKDVISFPIEFYPQTVVELMKGFPFEGIPLATDGAKHARLREPLQKALSPTRVRAMEPVMREIATRLINNFLSNGRAEIISQFAYPFPLEVILTMLGIPRQDLEMIKKLSANVLMLYTLPLSPEQQAESAREFVTLQHYYVQLIEEKRKNPQEDLISDLIRYGASGEEVLPPIDLLNLIASVVVAGHETAVHMIGNGLMLLLEDPTRWQAVCKHPELIPSAIEEILRLQGPGLGFIRTTTQEVTVGDITMQPGTRLFLLYASGNHDERKFPQAGNFEMQRQSNHHLAFGHGIHFCVGAALARLEGRIAFEVLTQYIPQIRIIPDQQFAYTPLPISYGHEHIHVQWDEMS